VTLRDAATDLAHDLLDIDVLAMLAGLFAAARLALFRRWRGSRPAPIVAAPVLAASPPVKVLPAPVLWILISHR
jgi:hypothetical protein